MIVRSNENENNIHLNDGVLNTGDIVRLIFITDEDKQHNRYVGELGIYQDRLDNDIVEVRFGNWGGYKVNIDAIEFVAKATIVTIFKAHCLEEETELIKDIQYYVNNIK